MELMAGVIGFLVAVLGLVLSVVTISNKVVKGVKAAAFDVLLESGLVKRGRKNDVWPNGSDTLPDFLAHMWESQRAMQSDLHDIKNHDA